MHWQCTTMHKNAYTSVPNRLVQWMTYGAFVSWHMEHFVSLLFIETDYPCQLNVLKCTSMHIVSCNASMHCNACKFTQCTKGIECMNAHLTSEFRWKHAGLLIVKDNALNALKCAMHAMHSAAQVSESMHWMHSMHCNAQCMQCTVVLMFQYQCTQCTQCMTMRNACNALCCSWCIDNAMQYTWCIDNAV